MQPPIVALWAVLFATKGTNARVAGDLHTAVFDNPKWTWSTGLTLRLLRGDNRLAIVTNEELATRIRDEGGQVLVLHDLIEEQTDKVSYSFVDSALEERLRGREYVLVPLTYAYDEPLQELQEAVARTPEILWVFTGRAPEEYRRDAPTNLFFTGFVSREDYDCLLSNAAAVVAPTTSESTMQRAGYEALGAARPLVITNTRVLIDYFGEAAVAASISPQSFAEAARKVLSNEATYTQRMAALRSIKLQEQELALKELSDWLGAK